MPPRRIPSGTRATPELLRSLCERWTRTIYDVSQWAYAKLQPGVIAERTVYAAGRRKADDVKCFAFHGRTALVQQVSDRFDVATGRPKGRGKRDTFYDPTTGKRVGYTVDGSKPLFPFVSDGGARTIACVFELRRETPADSALVAAVSRHWLRYLAM